MEPFIIKGVEANYPKIDQPYHFSQKENRSVPCDANAENAAYELNVRLTPEQTSELWAKMQAAWKEGRDESWPESIEPSFKKDGDLYEVKTRRKASYGPPLQRFADNSEAPADFKLTSGSIVNVAVQFVPYKMRDHGVALRLMGVQVLKYVEFKPPSPFDAVDGYTGSTTAAPDSDPFAEFNSAATVEPSSNFSF